MKEVWKDIKGYEGLYQVSNLGRVKNNLRNEIRKLTLSNSTGYLYVDLYKNNERKKFTVHRLVAICFINNKMGKLQVNHIDGDKTNNCVSNLEWVTKSENAKHYFNELGGESFWKGVTSYDHPLSKEVNGYCLKTGKLLYVFGSSSEAGRNGFCQGLVSAVARGERTHHKNIIWKYI